MDYLTAKERKLFEAIDYNCDTADFFCSGWHPLSKDCKEATKHCPDSRNYDGYIKRRNAARSEVANHFSTLPLITAANPEHRYASNGADLIHAHFQTNNIKAQTALPDFVMLTILENAQSVDLSRRMTSIPLASADVLMHSVLNATMAKAANRQHGYALSAMGISSILKASRERLQTGELNAGAYLAIREVFKRLFSDEAMAGRNATTKLLKSE